MSERYLTLFSIILAGMLILFLLINLATPYLLYVVAASLLLLGIGNLTGR